MSELSRLRVFKRDKMIPLENGWGFRFKNHRSPHSKCNLNFYSVFDQKQRWKYPAYESLSFKEALLFSKSYKDPKDFYAFEKLLKININPHVDFRLIDQGLVISFKTHVSNETILGRIPIEPLREDLEVEADRLLEKGVNHAYKISEILKSI